MNEPRLLVEIFDSPMCCATGLCGPTIDETLLDVNEMILTLKAENIQVERYQATTHTQIFLGNGDVMRLMKEQQLAALPITVIAGQVIKVGAYPTLIEIKLALQGEGT